MTRALARAEDPPRGGANQPIRREAKQMFVLSGEHAWNVVATRRYPPPWRWLSALEEVKGATTQREPSPPHGN